MNPSTTWIGNTTETIITIMTLSGNDYDLDL